MKFIRDRCYPIWSTKTITLVAVLLIAAIYLVVFWLSYSSIVVELQITLMIVAVCLFAFLTIGLYKGVRLERPHRDQPIWRSLRRRPAPPPPPTSPTLAELAEPPKSSQKDSSGLVELAGNVLSSVDLTGAPHIQIDLPGASDAGDDLVGCLVTLIVGIALVALLIIVLPIIAEIVWAGLFVLALALYWIFYRMLRIVFGRSRTCKGKLLRSVWYGLFYTALYTGWIAIVLLISRYVLTRG